MWKTFTTLLLILITTGLFSQIPVQNIRGKVIDASNGTALIGAYICLPGTEPLRGITTDDAGKYQLSEVPVGRYQLEVSFLGYETALIPEVLLESGKELILNLELNPTSSDLDAITVVAAGARGSSLSPVSVQTITVEESLRFPATFSDPARVAMTYPGVVNDNDQANSMVIRGNSPSSMAWRLEGAEIVNPNHLSNAGTFSDRVAQSGGGVNILSAQMLGTSNFFTGAFPANYGNALSGIMDMRFRNGNDEKHEFTIQAGLIGFDLSAEGPLSKKRNISYLVNYRYSFVGLLTSGFGVDFGGESIAFQDLAFNVSAPTKNGGMLKVFGMAGVSNNNFETERDTALWEFQKDQFDIDFESKMGAIGATYSTPVGKSGIWKTAAIASAIESKREGKLLDENLSPELTEFDSVFNRKLALNTSLSYKLNEKQRLKLGLSAMQQLFDQRSVDNGFVKNEGRGDGLLIEPYVQWTLLPIANLEMNLGLHYAAFTFNNSQSFEPRFSLRYKLDAKNTMSLAYGLHSKLQSPQLYFANTNSATRNEDLDFTKAQHAVLAYSHQLNQQTQIKAEAYFQQLYNVPINRQSSNSFSALNLQEGFVTDILVNDGTGQNYGLELSIQRFIADDYFFSVNGTYYESKYKGSDGIKRDTRFNGNYIFNVTGGKEFKWTTKKERHRILGVNARVVYLGGFRDTPIDTDLSTAAGSTVYVDSEAFSLKQKDFFKIDFRIYYKNNKKKYNSMVALDFQNLTNAQNEAYSYYDVQQSAVVQKYQLGMIPNLSYRIEF